MDALVRELEALRAQPDIPNSKVVGAVLSAAMRIRDILEWRIAGIEALATAIAMQPGIDAARLHRDFLEVLKARYESMRHVPNELKDMAAAIQLAATERK
jgi:hypothetical protein